jgi:integrase
LARFAGLRLNEALTLEWADIDFGGNRIRVNEGIDLETTKQRFRVCPIEPKRCPTGLTRILTGILGAAPEGSSLACHDVKRNNLRRTALGILRRSGVGEYAKPFHTLRKCRVSEVAVFYAPGILEEWFGHDAEVSRRHYQRVPDELYAPPANVQNGQSRVRKQRRGSAGPSPEKAVPARAGRAQVPR